MKSTAILAAIIAALIIFSPPRTVLAPTSQSQEVPPQNVTTEVRDRYAQARSYLLRSGPHWLAYVDSAIGTILVSAPGYIDFGPKLSNTLAVYFAADPRGIVILAPAFGGYDSYFEPSWPLWLASVLVHEATHDKQYRRGEEFTSASSCRQENEAVAQQSAFLLDQRSLVADYYRVRVLEYQRSKCG